MLLDSMLTACKSTDIDPEDNDDVPLDLFGALMLFVAYHNKESAAVDKVLDTIINKDLFRIHARILELCCEVDVTESMLDAVACFGMIIYDRVSSSGPGSDAFLTNPAPSEFLKPLWVPLCWQLKLTVVSCSSCGFMPFRLSSTSNIHASGTIPR